MIYVLKFGGLSLLNENMNDVIKVIQKYKNKGQVLVVVSAIGRNHAYSTNTLNDLATFVTPEEKDLLISTGEIISSVLLANNLKKANIDSIALSVNRLKLKAKGVFGNALIKRANLALLKKELKSKVVIVPGFIALKKNVPVTLGRGGSDLTAVFLGKKLKAKEIIFFKDTSGIYSGDPKIIKNPLYYPRVSFETLRILGENKIQLFQDKAAKILKKLHPNIIFTSIKERSYITKIITEKVTYKGIIVRRNSIKLIQYKEFFKDRLLYKYIHICKSIPKIDFKGSDVLFYDMIIFIDDNKVNRKIYKSSLSDEKITQIHDNFVKNMI